LLNSIADRFGCALLVLLRFERASHQPVRERFSHGHDVERECCCWRWPSRWLLPLRARRVDHFSVEPERRTFER
jgi:hypothetical protein